MKDHLAVIERRLEQVRQDQVRLEGENAALRKHGRALADYLTLLAQGKTAPEYKTDDIKAAMRTFGRWSVSVATADRGED